MCITGSKIELGKEGVYISYDNMGQFGGVVDAAGQTLDILVLVPAGAIEGKTLPPIHHFVLASIVRRILYFLMGGSIS